MYKRQVRAYPQLPVIIFKKSGYDLIDMLQSLVIAIIPVSYTHLPNPLLWQIAKVRSFDYDLGNIKDSQIAHEYVDSIKQTLDVYKRQLRD